MGGSSSKKEKPKQPSSNYSSPSNVRPSYPFSRPVTTNNSSNDVYPKPTQNSIYSVNNSNSYISQTRQSVSNSTPHRPNWNSEDEIRKLRLRMTQQLSCSDNAAPRRQTEAPERSKINYQLFDISDNDSAVTYTPLSQYDVEYNQINRMITNKHNFKVDSIIKITNPYLEKAYELKKEQKLQQYAYVEERLLFHGTKHAIVDSIIEENFDWRYCKAHKFGKGISFSPKATYAANYSDQNVHTKVMIVAKVLIGKSCMGNASMVLPDEGCDTSQKGDDGIVIVKYEDNEFYPAYKILYHLVDENIGRGNRNRRPVRQQNNFLNYNLDDDYIDFYNY